MNRPTLVSTFTLVMCTQGALLLVGCSSSGSSEPPREDANGKVSSESGAASVPCDPLAEVDKPTTLSNVLGIGRDAAGVIYVVDQPSGSDYRVFVSEPGALERRVVSGSGTTPDAVTITVDDGKPSAFALKLERAGAVTTKMDVLHGELEAKDFQGGAPGTESLAIVGADAIASLAVKNLPNTVSVLFDATTATSERLVVTRAALDTRYEDARVFVGVPSKMVEAKVTNASGGSATYLTFESGGVTRTAVFPAPPPIGSADAKPSLSTGSATTTLTLTTPPNAAGMSFLCLP